MLKKLFLVIAGLLVATSSMAPASAATEPTTESTTGSITLSKLPPGARLITVPERSRSAVPAGVYVVVHGYMYLQNANSSKCMGVAGSSLDNGAAAIQWTCHPSAGSDQRMMSRQVGGSNSIWQQLDPAHSVGRCLGVSGGSQSQGASLVQWSCNAAESNQAFAFRILHEGPDWYRVDVFALHSNQAIGIAGGGLNNGARAIQWPWRGTSANCTGDQCWWIRLAW